MIIPFKDVGSAGLMTDLLAYEVPDAAWSVGSNIRFRNGYAERFGGHKGVFGAPSVAPYAVFYAYVNGTRYVIYAGLSAVYAVANDTHTDITGPALTGDTNDLWTGGMLPGGIFVLSNEADAPMYWTVDIADPLATLPDWNANWRCRAIRPFKNFLMALNVTKSGVNYDRLAMWSSAADVGTLPTSWTPSTTNDAGEVDLDVSSPLVDAIQFGDSFLIFSENETVLCQYIGAPYIFKFQTISRTHGLLSQRCAAVVPGVGVLAVSRSDVMLHNGTESPKSIIDGRMKQYLFENLSSDFWARTFVVRDNSSSELWICFPTLASTGQCDQALVWNWVGNTWSKRSLPNVNDGCEAVIEVGEIDTFDSVTTTFDTEVRLYSDFDTPFRSNDYMMLSSSSNTKIYAMDFGADADGSAFPALIERTGLALGAPDRMKFLRAIRPRIDATAGTTVSVYAGGSFDPEGDVSWSGPYTYTVGTDLKVDCLVSGRYLGVRFETSANHAWRIRSFDLDVQIEGDY